MVKQKELRINISIRRVTEIGEGGNMLNDLGTFSYHPNQREQFISGNLITVWSEQFPDLFDDDDVRIAQSQAPYHFYEWLAAILINQSTGYLSLAEKYLSKNHRRKQNILAQLFTKDILDLLNSLGPTTLWPDLLVYSPNFTDTLFCEVKGPNDRLRKAQKESFDEIMRVLRIPIYTFRFKEMK